MILLYFGRDLSSSRREFLKYKNTFPLAEVISLAEETKPDQLIPALESYPLFGGSRLLTLESFSGQAIIFKDQNFLDYLRNMPASVNLVFWVGVDLPEGNVFLKTLRKLKAGVFQFKGKKAGSVFPFLTALLSRQRGLAYRELIRLRRDEQNEFFILTMVVWQIRQLLTYLYDPGSASIPVYTRRSLSRLSKQYGVSQVEDLYRQLHRVDIKSKSGGDLIFELFKFVETVNE